MSKILYKMFHALGRSERGGTAIEYGLICALIVIAMMGALKGFATVSVNMWSNVSNAVSNS
ncbi:Flp family type IVb pilin [Sphingobium aquiterrae]|uniref:Flp family type IVb pilin n=1 Tax=Sphingobium aquiterrae TaxID=2038656 RepID=UPI0030195424